MPPSSPRILLGHADGAIDCVVRGEGEGVTPACWKRSRAAPRFETLPGVVTAAGSGPPPLLVSDIERHRPARGLLDKRHRYFIGSLDPCASIEFSRGCPWDCTFCSAWTFYGRSYRKVSGGSRRRPGRHPRAGRLHRGRRGVHPPRARHAIADEIERRRIRKQYYLETRGDVLLRNKEVFARWRQAGAGVHVPGAGSRRRRGAKAFRKRVSLGDEFRGPRIRPLAGHRSSPSTSSPIPPGTNAALPIVREWALSIPEIVHMTVNTPYPGTETWRTESRNFTTRDYRLFDVQHAVLPTTLPLDRFYDELVKTQQVLNQKHLGWQALRDTFFFRRSCSRRGRRISCGCSGNLDRFITPSASLPTTIAQ